MNLALPLQVGLPMIGREALAWPALALVAMAVVLGWPVPRLLPRVSRLRRTPGLAIVLWQAVSLSAVGAALLAAPVAVVALVGRRARPVEVGWLLPALGLATTAFVAVRLLVRAHLVGTALRSARRRHRELVDLIALPAPAGVQPSGDDPAVRVLEHPTPTAYCVPGGGQRVVLSQGTLQALSAPELAAVLAHERAHLAARHDLVLEFFTVWHTAVPAAARSAHGLAEVQLLIELLADRVAAAQVGPVPLARALTALSQSAHPVATMGADGQALVRVKALSAPPAGFGQRSFTVAAIVVTVAAPLLIAGAGLW